MILELRDDWAPAKEMPSVAMPEPAPAPPPAPGHRRGKSARPKARRAAPGDSEAEKHNRCSRAMRALNAGATHEEAARASGMSVAEVERLSKAYPKQQLAANAKHQVDDQKLVGPWSDSRHYQSGGQRYKNDFHSYHFCYSIGYTEEEAFMALLN